MLVSVSSLSLVSILPGFSETHISLSSSVTTAAVSEGAIARIISRLPAIEAIASCTAVKKHDFSKYPKLLFLYYVWTYSVYSELGS